MNKKTVRVEKTNLSEGEFGFSYTMTAIVLKEDGSYANIIAKQEVKAKSPTSEEISTRFLMLEISETLAGEYYSIDWKPAPKQLKLF